MTDLENLVFLAGSFENQANGDYLIVTLNIIANLMREIDNRHSKATYYRRFDLGKLIITVDFDGMK